MNLSLNPNEKAFRRRSGEISIRRGQGELKDNERRVHLPDVHANCEQLLVGENVRPMGGRSHQ